MKDSLASRQSKDKRKAIHGISWEGPGGASREGLEGSEGVRAPSSTVLEGLGAFGRVLEESWKGVWRVRGVLGRSWGATEHSC